TGVERHEINHLGWAVELTERRGYDLDQAEAADREHEYPGEQHRERPERQPLNKADGCTTSCWPERFWRAERRRERCLGDHDGLRSSLATCPGWRSTGRGLYL